MKKPKSRLWKVIVIFTVGLIILSAANFGAAQKRTMRQKLPVKSRFQFVTVLDVTFKIPANWKKNEFDENLWESPDGLSLKTSIYPLSAEDVLKSGGYTIEKDLEIFYESHKKYGTEDVRYLEIDGVKGVHRLMDDEDFSTKYVYWNFLRARKGQRQLGNISFSMPAKTFAKNKAAIYRLLQSIKFAKE